MENPEIAAIVKKVPADIIHPSAEQKSNPQARGQQMRTWTAANADGKKVSLVAYSREGAGYLFVSKDNPAYTFRISPINRKSPLPTFKWGDKVQITGTIGKGGLSVVERTGENGQVGAEFSISLQDATVTKLESPTTQPTK